MKKNIHPASYPVTFKYVDGKEIKLLSTLGRKDKEVVHNTGDWPLTSHTAWTKTFSSSVKSATNIKKFNAKFQSSIFGAANQSESDTKKEQ